MRYFNAILCLLMLLFVSVQYNDPDGPLWMAIYAVPAVWSGIAALRPALLDKPGSVALLGLSLLGGIGGMIYYWPHTPQWWTRSVWWEVETAREGMGVMILTAVLAFVLLYATLRRRRSRGSG